MQRWKKLSLLLLSINCAIIFSIAVDRVAGYILTSTGYFKVFQPNLDIKYDTLEFTVEAKISDQGIRNEHVAIPKPKGVYRILALGDSFMYGWGVNAEDSWIKIVEKSLNKTGNKVEIVNAGLPGAGINDENKVCNAYRNQIDADAIILSIYSDDIYQAALRKQNTTLLQSIILRSWPTLSNLSHTTINMSGNGLDIQMPGNVIQVSEVWKEEAHILLKQDPRLLLNIDPKLRSDFLRGKLNPGLVGRSQSDPTFLVYRLNPVQFNYAITAFDQSLDSILFNCAKNKPIFIVFIPGPTSINSYYQSFKRELGFIVSPDLLSFPINEYVNPVLDKKNIPHASLLEPFRKAGCKDCFYPYDGHLTPVGNKKLAAYIEPMIKEFIQNNQKH